ncbi:Hypothetical protein HVR_LOCUS685 [uncultured virus]|nr:Hypothetical protein HVR_LOCUS685 [uncultured virus]
MNEFTQFIILELDDEFIVMLIINSNKMMATAAQPEISTPQKILVKEIVEGVNG